jgi:hypothetical protein
MCRFAKDGRHLANLVGEAAAVCRAADQSLPKRKGPGRPVVYQQWQIAGLIVIAIAHRCKGKSSQYRWLSQHQELLEPLLKMLQLKQLPSRATYCRVYRQVYRLYREAIRIGGRRALQEHCTDARTVAIDKSMIAARGPHPSRYKKRKGVDQEAGWGKSAHHGWKYGYSYEVVVSAGKNRLVMPLLASADRANCSEHRSGITKVPDLPRGVRNALVDCGYDDNEFAEAIEYTPDGKRTGRRLLCPLQSRGGRPQVGKTVRKGRRELLRRHRLQRARFMKSRYAKRLFARRSKTIEPFNQWFKHLFELEQHVWHRGLKNNQTMLMASLFTYQLLQRYNYACGHRDGQISWILDGL